MLGLVLALSPKFLALAYSFEAQVLGIGLAARGLGLDIGLGLLPCGLVNIPAFLHY